MKAGGRRCRRDCARSNNLLSASAFGPPEKGPFRAAIIPGDISKVKRRLAAGAKTGITTLGNPPIFPSRTHWTPVLRAVACAVSSMTTKLQQ